MNHQNINKLSQYRFRKPVLHDESIAAGRKHKSMFVCLFVCICGSILLGLFGLEPVLSRLRPVTHDPRTHPGERSTQQLHPHRHTPCWEGDKGTGKQKMIKNQREREGALSSRASIYSPDLLCLLLKFTSTVIQPVPQLIYSAILFTSQGFCLTLLPEHMKQKLLEMFIWDVNPEVLSESVIKSWSSLMTYDRFSASVPVSFTLSVFVCVVCQGFSGPLFSVISFPITFKDSMKSLQEHAFSRNRRDILTALPLSCKKITAKSHDLLLHNWWQVVLGGGAFLLSR